MKKIKKLFGEINLTWPKLIILAVIMGIYTAIMALIPILKYTSFHDIAVTYEVWILFGIIIITNSKSAGESALKCFVFFLISQVLVYLIQVPFTSDGFGIFRYYNYWFIWTVACIPMGYIGYQIKKDKWWSLLIIVPILLFLGVHYYNYLQKVIYNFPYHLLTILFCLITILFYPIVIFKNKKIKLSGVIISVLIIISSTILAFLFRYSYKTTILISNDSYGISFDDSYKVHLDDNKMGKVYIKYDEGIESYVINAEFYKAGNTNLVINDNKDNKIILELIVNSDSFDIFIK